MGTLKRAFANNIKTDGTLVTLNSASVVQHSPETDLQPVKNDIAILALHSAVQDNQTAHGLSNVWVEQFQDSNFIENETDGTRQSAEYWETNTGAGEDTRIDVDYANMTSGNGWGFTYSNLRNDTYSVPDHNQGLESGDNPNSYKMWAQPGAGWIAYDMLQSYDVSSILTWQGTNVPGLPTTYQILTSNDGSSWTTQSGSQNNASRTSSQSMGGAQSGQKIFNFTDGNNESISVACRHIKLYYSASSGGNWGSCRFYIREAGPPPSNTASFTSTQIAPQDSAAKTSARLVVLYKEATGSTTLNTHLVGAVSADNGSNYTNCVLEDVGYFGVVGDGIKIASSAAVTVTSGTQLRYRMSFTGQAEGSLLTRVYGVAMLY